MIGDRLGAEFGRCRGRQVCLERHGPRLPGRRCCGGLARARHPVARPTSRQAYLTARVPELEFADLPFLFGSLEEASGRHGWCARRLSQPVLDSIDIVKTHGGL